nr:hypothetical protein [Caballeronia calidae]
MPKIARCVALGTLRTRTPVRHDATWVEHVDRVIGDSFDQQTEAALGIARLLMQRARLCQVARDLREAEQLAVVLMNGIDDHVRPETRAVLAHAPAFRFVLALRKRDGETARGRARLPAFRRVKTLKCLPTISFAA